MRSGSLLVCLCATIAVAACGDVSAELGATTSTSVPMSTTETSTSTDDRVPALTTTTVAVNPPTTGEVPGEILDEILLDVAERSDVPRDEVSILRSEAIDWSDGSLGCPEPGQLYTQAIVPGYWVEIEAAEMLYDYRVDGQGGIRLCE